MKEAEGFREKILPDPMSSTTPPSLVCVLRIPFNPWSINPHAIRRRMFDCLRNVADRDLRFQNFLEIFGNEKWVSEECTTTHFLKSRRNRNVKRRSGS